MFTFTCNCEHVSHFPISEHDLPEWRDIPRTGHKYCETVISDREPQQAAWVGDVCQSCKHTCLGGGA